MQRILLVSLAFILSFDVISQALQPVEQDRWGVYMAMYDKGAGSVTLNMDLVRRAPEKDKPFILITGVTYTNCRKDGFPETGEMNKLYDISDNVLSLLPTLTAIEYAGAFTYQCERLDYVYLKDTVGIRAKLVDLYQSKYKNYKYSIKIKKDEAWEAYLQFLYPNEETQEYMSNENVVMQLKKGGDNLSKPRKVDHWVYFKTLQDRDSFERLVLKKGFKVENKGKSENPELPFQLGISRTDKVDMDSITKVTIDLRQAAKQSNGYYDGWETVIVK